MNEGTSPTSGSVLLISGDEPTATILARHLSEAGHHASVTSSCEASEQSLAAYDVDVVLLDLRSFASVGRALVRNLKSSEMHSDIPVILLGTPDMLDDIESCLTAGAEDYLLAPFSPALLRTQVQTCLGVRHQRGRHREVAKREELLKIERDVHIARQIQLSFLPHELPQLAGWDFSARFEPAREVAGDFYDVFGISQGRRICAIIADVCDKGVGAALFMALTRSLIRAFAQQNYTFSLADVVSNEERGAAVPLGRRPAPSTGTIALKNAVTLTNRYITENHSDLNMFATLFFGLIDPATGSLDFINCGHNPPVIRDAQGNLKTHLKRTGPAIGMVQDAHFQIEQTQLEPGDLLFCYTDGITEARADDRSFFGSRRLETILAQPTADPASLLDEITASLHAHMSGAPQYDDITMLAVSRCLES